MNNMNDIYNDLIMEHSMNSYNKKKLSSSDYKEMGHNPNCGDEISLEVKLNGNMIEDMAFSGHGCAISQASTSIMIDTLKGKTVEEAKEIVKTFIAMIKREKTNPENLKKLEDAIAFQNICNMPSRVKCARFSMAYNGCYIRKKSKWRQAVLLVVVIIKEVNKWKIKKYH